MSASCDLVLCLEVCLSTRKACLSLGMTVLMQNRQGMVRYFSLTAFVHKSKPQVNNTSLQTITSPTLSLFLKPNHQKNFWKKEFRHALGDTLTQFTAFTIYLHSDLWSRNIQQVWLQAQHWWLFNLYRYVTFRRN